MLKFNSALAIAAAATALSAGGVSAQGALSNSLAKMDKNSDGKVSLEEWQAGKPKQFRNFDGNKDGSVTRDEALAYYTKVVPATDRKTPASRVDALFKADANSDGVLTYNELLASGELEFKGRDKDGDGFLTPADEKKK